jgi:hypothetical protein
VIANYRRERKQCLSLRWKRYFNEWSCMEEAYAIIRRALVHASLLTERPRSLVLTIEGIA